jgi:hypothetical protein
VRAQLGLLLAALLVAGCSGSPAHHYAHALTLRVLSTAPGPDVALVAGASDFAPGPIRYSFLVVDSNGASIERPRAKVWLARSLDSRPFEQAKAELESVGVRGGYRDRNVTHIYVVHLRVSKPGTYWVLAEPVGGRAIQGFGNLIVHAHSLAPAIGSRAYPSQSPTLTSTHNIHKLTTRVPPDRALLRYSIAGSLAAHKPFVVVFATPKFCTSRTCGPVVDVVNTVRRRFAGRDIRFIHVEIYRDNDPLKGFNRWVTQWHLPTEPWVFLVGANGRIKAKFEGSLSVTELTGAVRKALL